MFLLACLCQVACSCFRLVQQKHLMQFMLVKCFIYEKLLKRNLSECLLHEKIQVGPSCHHRARWTSQWMTQASVLSFALGLVDIARQVDNLWHRLVCLSIKGAKMKNQKLECLSCQNAWSCWLDSTPQYKLVSSGYSCFMHASCYSCGDAFPFKN